MRSRIPLIVKIETENLKFDLLIYKDPAILFLSAAQLLAEQDMLEQSLPQYQPPAIKKAKRVRKIKKGDQAGHPSGNSDESSSI